MNEREREELQARHLIMRDTVAEQSARIEGLTVERDHYREGLTQARARIRELEGEVEHATQLLERVETAMGKSLPQDLREAMWAVATKALNEARRAAGKGVDRGGL